MVESTLSGLLFIPICVAFSAADEWPERIVLWLSRRKRLREAVAKRKARLHKTSLERPYANETRTTPRKFPSPELRGFVQQQQWAIDTMLNRTPQFFGDNFGGYYRHDQMAYVIPREDLAAGIFQ